MQLLPYLLLIGFVAVANGAPASCTGCHCCEPSLITIRTSGAGAHEMNGDDTNRDGECSVRTFTCNGEQANIEVNIDGGVEVIRSPNEAKFEVTCNAAGTAWEAQGIAVTHVECASIPE